MKDYEAEVMDAIRESRTLSHYWFIHSPGRMEAMRRMVRAGTIKVKVIDFPNWRFTICRKGKK